MLIGNQHFLGSPSIVMSVETVDYYFADRGCLVDFFAMPDEKLAAWLGIEPITINLSTKSGPFYLEISPDPTRAYF